MGFFKGLLNVARGILGIDTKDDLGKKYDEQLKAQQEANKLNAANEAQNIAQFNDSGGDSTFTGTDTRRRKRDSGAAANALGLQV